MSSWEVKGGRYSERLVTEVLELIEEISGSKVKVGTIPEKWTDAASMVP